MHCWPPVWYPPTNTHRIAQLHDKLTAAKLYARLGVPRLTEVRAQQLAALQADMAALAGDAARGRYPAGACRPKW